MPFLISCRSSRFTFRLSCRGQRIHHFCRYVKWCFPISLFKASFQFKELGIPLSNFLPCIGIPGFSDNQASFNKRGLYTACVIYWWFRRVFDQTSINEIYVTKRKFAHSRLAGLLCHGQDSLASF